MEIGDIRNHTHRIYRAARLSLDKDFSQDSGVRQRIVLTRTFIYAMSNLNY